MESLVADFLFIGKGILVTMQLVTGGIIIGSLLGMCAAIMRYLNKAKILINVLVSIIRGTPLMLQLAIIYFSLPSLLGIKLDIVTAGVITFGLNSSAYVAEILRAGILSIPKGQFEAARTLAISPFHMWKDIILPQVFNNILPAMINEIIALLKETALIATIGGMDLMRLAQTLAAQKFTYFTPLCIAGLYYYLLVMFIEYIGKIFEKRNRYAQS